MEIKPIETRYNGYRFRSRAEARWAVFFDAAGINYLYEPEGVRLSDGTLYLPDFYLPDCKTWFEVKGVLNDVDLHKVEQLIADTQRPVVIGYPDLTFQACDNWEDGYVLVARCDSTLCRCKSCGNLWFMGWNGSFTCECCGAYDGDHHFNAILDGDRDYYYLLHDGDKVICAYNKARQARFEHGETP